METLSKNYFGASKSRAGRMAGAIRNSIEALKSELQQAKLVLTIKILRLLMCSPDGACSSGAFQNLSIHVPERLCFQNLPVHRAIMGMRARQVTGAHQEFTNDLAAGEAKSFFEQLYPFVLCLRMMRFQPFFKGTGFLLKLKDRFRIFYGGIYLEPVADDAGIVQQPFPVSFGIGGNLLYPEIMIRFPEAGLFLQDGLPAQARLVDLHEKPAKQLVVVVNGKPVMLIVIGFMQGFLLSGHADDIAAIGHVVYFEDIILIQ
jgi:hypothetical protein